MMTKRLWMKVGRFVGGAVISGFASAIPEMASKRKTKKWIAEEVARQMERAFND